MQLPRTWENGPFGGGVCDLVHTQKDDYPKGVDHIHQRQDKLGELWTQDHADVGTK
jgi:hypothetical protein